MKYFFIPVILFLAGASYATDYSFSIQGKSYKLVKTKKSWTDAAAWAAQDGGHLVHIESKAEQDSLWAAIQASGISMQYTSVADGGGVAYVWIGGTDKQSEGTWLWDGDNDGNGTNFYKGQGSWGANNGAPVNGAYVNWGGTNTGTGSNEPDNYAGNQDGAAIALEPWPAAGMGNIAGEWNDINISNQLYFIVEYETAGIKHSQNLTSPKMLIINKGNNKLGFKSKKVIKSISIFSVSGAEIAGYHNINDTEFELTLPGKGVYFYKSSFDDNTVESDKILIL